MAIITPLGEDPLEILVRHIADGTLNAAPDGIAVVGWVCDFLATEPHFVSLYQTSDGFLMAQPSDDLGATVFLGTPAMFLDQLALVCHNCGLTDAQTKTVMDTARRKIG